jgi:hypothetical protein
VEGKILGNFNGVLEVQCNDKFDFFFNFSFTLEVKEMFPSWYLKNIRFFSSFFFTSGVWEIIYFNA